MSILSVFQGPAISFLYKAIKLYFDKVTWEGYFAVTNEECHLLDDDSVKKIANYTYKSNAIRLTNNIRYELEGFGIKKDDIELFLSIFISKTENKNPIFSVVYKLESKADITDFDRLETFIIQQSYCNIDEIDYFLRKRSMTKCGHEIGIDFYNFENPEFHKAISSLVKEKRECVIYGKYFKETLYALLFELKKILGEDYLDRVCVFSNIHDYEKAKSSLNYDSILVFDIPQESIPSDSNFISFRITTNTLYKKNACVLSNRLFDNTKNQLVKCGLPSVEAYELTKRCSNRFPLLYREIYSSLDAYLEKITGSIDNDDAISCALLVPQIAINNSKDTEFIQTLSNVGFDQYRNILMSKNAKEYPLVDEKEDWRDGRILSTIIIDLHDMYSSLLQVCNEKMMNKYFDMVECLFNELASSDQHKYGQHYSQAFIEGLFNAISIIYFYGEYKYRPVIEGIFDGLITKAKENDNFLTFVLENISIIVEITPKEILLLFKDGITNQRGIYNLFNKKMSYYGNDYTSVLWALEKLFFVKEYRNEAIDICFDIATIETEYKISNTPYKTLATLLAAWIHTTDLIINDKKSILSRLFEKNDRTAFNICSNLVYVSGASLIPFNPPSFLYYNDYKETVTIHEAFELYKFYAIQYINHCKTLDDWNSVFDKHIAFVFDLEDKKKYYKKMFDAINELDDEQKEDFYINVKKFIHRNRRFANSDWAASEDELEIIENNLEDLIFENQNRKYTYLYLRNYETYLEHPLVYEDKNDYENNKKYEENALKDKEKEILDSGIDCIDLFHLVLNRTNKKREVPSFNLIELVIKYLKSKGLDDVDAMVQVLSDENVGDFIVDNIGYYFKNKSIDNYYSVVEKLFNKIVSIAKATRAVYPFNFNINDKQFMHIFDNLLTPEHKDYYYKHLNEFGIIPPDVDSLNYLLNGIKNVCYNQGERNKYADVMYAFVFNYPNVLSPFEILSLLASVDDSILINTSDYNNLVELIERLQDGFRFFGDDSIKSKIASLEMKYLLKEQGNKCLFLKDALANDATIYFDILKKSIDKTDQSQRYGDILFSIDYSVRFCPGYKSGIFDEQLFNKWIEVFTDCINSLGMDSKEKDHLLYYKLGQCIANCGNDNSDGLPVPMAIRNYIENISNKDNLNTFSTDYVFSIRNKLGLRTISDGSDLFVLCDEYESVSKQLREKGFPNTSAIYHTLAEGYKDEAERERRKAEDE